MMQTTARLLLPFNERIDTLAIDYAVLTAKRLGATLVPLALIFVRPGQRARAEHMQQAQDFLVLTRTKAQRQQVAIEPAQLYTSDLAQSVERFAAEMHCETVLFFLKERGTALLSRREIQALTTRLTCNMQIWLLPVRQIKSAGRSLVSVPLVQDTQKVQQASALRNWQPVAFVQWLLASVFSPFHTSQVTQSKLVEPRLGEKTLPTPDDQVKIH